MSKFKVLETRGQSFANLCSLLPMYSQEVGTSGHRSLLQSHGIRLERAFAAAAAVQRQGMSPQSTHLKGVKNLVAFHTSQQTHVKAANQERLNDEVILVRKFLSRQGAWFSGDGKLNWPRTEVPVIRYDSELARQKLTRVRISGGMLVGHDGKLLDTAGMVTFFSGVGHAIYVMSAEGNLHVHSHSIGHYHHSSLLAGANVAGAGEIAVTNGRIKSLSNKSGHYVPNQEHLLNVLAMLQHAGVHLSFALTVAPQLASFGTVGEFMRHIMQDDETLERLSRAVASLAQVSPPAAGNYTTYTGLNDYPAAKPVRYGAYKSEGAAPASGVYEAYRAVDTAASVEQQVERGIYYRSLG